MRTCRYGTFVCSPVKVSDSARHWCKVSPVNSNKCLKVVFSASLVGFTGGGGTQLKRPSDVHLWFLKCCSSSFIAFHHSALVLMNLMTQKRSRKTQLFLWLITKTATRTGASLHTEVISTVWEANFKDFKHGGMIRRGRRSISDYYSI